MPFGQTQEQRDNYRLFDDAIEGAVGDRMALGKLDVQIKGSSALDETDRSALLGRLNQYLVDMDKADAMDRGDDLMGGSDEDAG